MFTNLTRISKYHKDIVQNKGFQLFLRHLHKKKPIPVTLEKPKLGWTKLNFDGSFKSRTENASIGGFLRDHDAKFLLGYAESIGKISSSNAELASLCRGLELVLDNGCGNVWPEGNSKALVNLIGKTGSLKSIQAQKYVNDINVMVDELDNVVLTHIYREGNRVADKFAELGHYLEDPRVWTHAPPGEVLPIMHDDAQGKIVLRRRKELFC